MEEHAVKEDKRWRSTELKRIIDRSTDLKEIKDGGALS